MNERRSMGIIFIVSLLFTIGLLMFIVININLILTVRLYQIIVLITVLNFMLFFVSYRKLSAEIKYDIDEHNQKEKSVRDYYQYIQLLDPPEYNN